jgi:shikimate dehydrogenase
MAEDGGYFRLGLVGWPLGHSLSPRIHECFLRANCLQGDYSLYPVEPERFGSKVPQLLRSGVTGLNVTFPHKARASEICDDVVTDTARPAVNTVCISGDTITGYNTDTYGFGCYIDRFDLEEPFFVVGSGGAALAVDGLLSRRGLSCRIFCRDTAGWGGFAAAESIAGLQSSVGSQRRGTLVNATTLGWRDEDPFPVKGEALEGMVFADLNYNRGWAYRNGLTRFSVPAVTGEVMLVHQAAASFRIWTGILPDTGEVLRELDPTNVIDEDEDD